MEKIFIREFPEIGKVRYLLNRKIKYLRLRLQPFKLVSISVPQGLSIREADEFISQKKDWILKQQEKLRKFEAEVKQRKLDHTSEIDKEALTELINRAAFLAERYKFKINNIRIKRQRTRWGSCSSKGNINLNINLVHLPETLRDYVILHELVHIKVQGHGPVFWKKLSSYTSEPYLLNKQLKEYRYLLYT